MHARKETIEYMAAVMTIGEKMISEVMESTNHLRRGTRFRDV